LFTRRLQEQRPQPRKSVLDSSPDYGSFSSETKHDGRPKLFRRGDYRNTSHNPEKSVMGSSPG
jgi:hypothetical protein